MCNIHCSGAVLRLDLSDCGNDVGSGLCKRGKKENNEKYYSLSNRFVNILNRI